MVGYLTVPLIALAAVGECAAQDDVHADRTPLTFRDSGLYANLQSIHGRDPVKDGVTNLLTAERAADPDTPWDFFIMQYNAEEPSAELAERVKTLAANGKRVILRVLLGKEEHKIDLDRAKQRLENLFRETDPGWVYAITLDEENVYWLGNTQTLTDLYAWCKGRWPELPVYQWWTPMVAPEVGATGGWVALPADGWVLDLYGQRAEAFERKLLKFLATGVPAVHIAWASPTWIFYVGEGYTKDDWWGGPGRRIFDDQVRVCREYDVPVAYFCCQQAEVRDGKRIAPIRWGWHAVDAATRRWFLELEAIVSGFDYLPEEEIGYRSVTDAKLAWARSSRPAQMTFSIDEEGRRRFSFRTTFPDASTEPGRHVARDPFDNTYLRLSYTLDDSASRLSEGFAVRGVEGHIAQTPIVFAVEPLRPAAEWSVAAEVIANSSLGGSAKLEASLDGKTWLRAAASELKAGATQILTVDPAQLAGVSGGAPFWLRVTLTANSGKKTNVASRLNYLELSASLKKLPGDP